jgi:20S proteasome alpha/beta subunit
MWKYSIAWSLQRSPSALSVHQRKVFQVDKHIAMGIAGLTSDGRSLWYEATA